MELFARSVCAALLAVLLAVPPVHAIFVNGSPLPNILPGSATSGTITSAMTGTTSTSLVAAPAAGLRNYLLNCTFSNSHATVGTDILIQDGSGGTSLYVAPSAAVFGGAAITFPYPGLRQPTTATAVFVANVTTGANTKASCSGYAGP